MKKVTFLALLFALAVGCKKENALNNTNPSNPTGNTKQNSTSGLRTVNGFDFDLVGQAHNDRLDYLAGFSNLSTMTVQDMTEELNKYNDPVFGNVNLDGTEADKKVNSLSAFLDQYMADSTGLVPTLVSNGEIPADLEPFAYRFLGIFYGAYNPNDGSAISVAQFNSQINQLEDWVVANYNISYDPNTKIGNEGAAMLASCAIARYSYDYWMKVLDNPNDPWHFKFAANGAQRSLLGRAWRAIKTGAADAWGFVSDWHDAYDKNGNWIGWDWNYDSAVANASNMSAGVQ